MRAIGRSTRSHEPARESDRAHQIVQREERARPNFGVKSLQEIRAAKAAAAQATPGAITKAGSISQSANTSSEGSGEQKLDAEDASAQSHKSEDFKGKLKVTRGRQSLDVSFEKHVPQGRLEELRRRKAEQAAS